MKNDKRQVADATEVLTNMIEGCTSEQLEVFVDKYTTTKDFKNNHRGVPECFANLKYLDELNDSKRKALINDVVNFIKDDYARKQTEDMMNSDIGQMMFGWLFSGEEPKEEPKVNIKLDLGLDSKYKRERNTYVSPTKILEEGRHKNNETLQLNLKINRRMFDTDVLKTVQFGSTEVSDEQIMSMQYTSTKQNGKSRVNIPYEYLSIAENNSRLDNVKLNDYLEILVVDSIRKGRMVRDIISDNRDIFEENLTNNMLSIYTPLFQTTKLEYNTYTIKNLDDRHILVTLKRDYDSEFKFQFKFDLALNRVCM